MNKTFGISLFLFSIYLILGVLTLPRYGINWDTINHLPRGQAYLNYFLTGKKDYSNLPEWKWYWQKPENLLINTDIPKEEIPRRSLYQNDATTFNWFLEYDGKGHPPLSDILSSSFNLVLFQKLGVINDIDSYRVYGVFLAAALVGLVFWWTSRVYGLFAGLVAALSLSLYPLFWSESHFNTEKDIPETVYWGFLLFSVWRGVVGKSWKWTLLSGVFFGLALGTKFNVLFIPFVILPWLFAVVGHNYLKKRFSVSKSAKKNIKIVIAALTAPLIGFGIFLASWPYLWSDPITKVDRVIGFYKGIGLTQNVDPRFLGPFGTSTFPLQWILYTTPLVILGLGILGFFVGLSRIKREKDKTSLLLLLWLAVPMARVVWPGTTVYGGIRQIMEYIPPFAILAGLGGAWVFEKLNRKISKIFSFFIVILPFAFLILNLARIHPNENVYFNSLIGGLSGAKERNFPFWGLSFGAPYREGAIWLNENAEEGANIVYAHELIPNIPRIWLRQDINLHNGNRSGYLQMGEYAITLTYQGTKDRSYYDGYLETFVNPVYKTDVDNVSILKIWKNERSSLKFDLKEERVKNVVLEEGNSGIAFDLGSEYKLSRLEINYKENNCQPLESGVVKISRNGSDWQTLVGVLPNYWRVAILGKQPTEGKFIEPFYGQSARYINLVLSPSDTCLKNIVDYEVFNFDSSI